MNDPSRETVATFLQDHPDAVAGIKIHAGDVYMNRATLGRYLAWGLTRGIWKDQEKAAEFLATLPAFEEAARQQWATRQQHAPHDQLIMRHPAPQE
jgi:hypothetical protein